MTTLRSRMQELQRLLEGHQQSEAENLAIGRAAKATERLGAQLDTVQKLSVSAVELRNHEMPIQRPSSLDLVREALDHAQQEAREDGLAAGRGDEPVVVKLTNQLAQELKEQVIPAWARFKQHRPPPVIDEQLLDLAVEDDPDLSQRYELRLTSLTALSHQTAPAAGDVSRWSSLVQELREISTQVAATAPSQAVREFVAAAGSDAGATVELLEEESVRRWLDEQGRRERYRVFTVSR